MLAFVTSPRLQLDVVRPVVAEVCNMDNDDVASIVPSRLARVSQQSL